MADNEEGALPKGVESDTFSPDAETLHEVGSPLTREPNALNMISVQLSGNSWEHVLKTHFQVLEDAAIFDVYACLGKRECDPSSSGLQVEFSPSSTGTELTLKQANGALETHFISSQQDRLREYTYDNVMQMYQLFKEEDDNGIGPEIQRDDMNCEFRSHSLRFRGDWTSILLQRRCDWIESFCMDVSRHLTLLPSDIRDIRLVQQEANMELEVTFVLRIPFGLLPFLGDCAERLSECRYGRVWSMYFEAYPSQIPHDLHFHFLGEHWEPLLEAYTSEFEEAALEDVNSSIGDPDEAAALGVATMFIMSKESAHLLCKFAWYTDAIRDSVGQRLEGCTFENVWDLYRQLSSISTVIMGPLKLVNSESMINYLGVEGATLENVAFESDVPKGRRGEESTSPGSSGLDVREGGRNININFRGEKWHGVVNHHLEALQMAAAADMRTVLEKEQYRMVDTDEMSPSGFSFLPRTDGARLSFAMLVSAASDEEIDDRVQQALRHYKYPNVWRVYHLYAPKVYRNTASDTNCAVTGLTAPPLPGNWSRIMSYRYGDLLQAFCVDTSGTLGCKPCDIDGVHFVDQNHIPALANRFDVSPSSSQSLVPHPETEIWLCCFPRSNYLLLEEHHQLHMTHTASFEPGGPWLSLLDSKPLEMQEAALKDVEGTIGASESYAEQTRLYFSGSADKVLLHTQFVPSSSASAVTASKLALDQCTFPALWDLFRQLSDSLLTSVKREGLLLRDEEEEEEPPLQLENDEIRTPSFKKTTEPLASFRGVEASPGYVVLAPVDRIELTEGDGVDNSAESSLELNQTEELEHIPKEKMEKSSPATLISTEEISASNVFLARPNSICLTADAAADDNESNFPLEASTGAVNHLSAKKLVAPAEEWSTVETSPGFFVSRPRCASLTTEDLVDNSAESSLELNQTEELEHISKERMEKSSPATLISTEENSAGNVFLARPNSICLTADTAADDDKSAASLEANDNDDNQVVSLLDRVESEGVQPFVVQRHISIRLAGNMWDVILVRLHSQLEEAFRLDVQNATGFSGSDVRNVCFTVGSLHCDFDILCPEDVTETDIIEMLKRNGLPETWKLYGGCLGDHSDVTATQDDTFPWRPRVSCWRNASAHEYQEGLVVRQTGGASLSAPSEGDSLESMTYDNGVYKSRHRRSDSVVAPIDGVLCPSQLGWLQDPTNEKDDRSLSYEDHPSQLSKNSLPLSPVRRRNDQSPLSTRSKSAPMGADIFSLPESVLFCDDSDSLATREVSSIPPDYSILRRDEMVLGTEGSPVVSSPGSPISLEKGELPTLHSTEEQLPVLRESESQLATLYATEEVAAKPSRSASYNSETFESDHDEPELSEHRSSRELTPAPEEEIEEVHLAEESESEPDIEPEPLPDVESEPLPDVESEPLSDVESEPLVEAVSKMTPQESRKSFCDACTSTGDVGAPTEKPPEHVTPEKIDRATSYSALSDLPSPKVEPPKKLEGSSPLSHYSSERYSSASDHEEAFKPNEIPKEWAQEESKTMDTCTSPIAVSPPHSVPQSAKHSRSSSSPSKVESGRSPLSIKERPSHKDSSTDEGGKSKLSEGIKMRVGFHGTHWPALLEQQREEFIGIFVSEVAAMLQCSFIAVDDLEVSTSKGVVINFRIKTKEKSSAIKLLRNAPFPKVWEFYDSVVDKMRGSEVESSDFASKETELAPAAPPSKPEPMTNTHILFFEGRRWNEVLDHQWTKFEKAFCSDTHSALRRPVQDIRISEIQYENKGMKVKFEVTALKPIRTSARPLHSDRRLLTPTKFTEVKGLYEKQQIKRHESPHGYKKPNRLLPLQPTSNARRGSVRPKKPSKPKNETSPPRSSKKNPHEARQPHGIRCRCNICDDVYTSVPRARSESTSASSYLRPTCSYLQQTSGAPGD